MRNVRFTLNAFRNLLGKNFNLPGRELHEGEVMAADPERSRSHAILLALGGLTPLPGPWRYLTQLPLEAELKVLLSLLII